MTQTVEALFDQAIERYQAGEAAETLIPVFSEICDRAPKSGVAWTCLAWLYLLVDKPNQALKSAQKAVKLNSQDPQAQVNLAVAMLEAGQKGVRQHIELVQQILMAAPELKQDVKQNCEDGLCRKPQWQSLKRVKTWIFEDQA